MKLTNLEKRALIALGYGQDQNGWREEGFSDMSTEDLASEAGFSMATAKGVLGSLVSKGLVFTDSNGDGDIQIITIKSDDGWEAQMGTGGGWAVYDEIKETPLESLMGSDSGDNSPEEPKAKEDGKETAEEPEKVVLSSGVVVTAKKVVTIKCSEEGCDNERIIKVQDAFQVTRCVDCQKKHRNKMRSERRKPTTESRIKQLKELAQENYEAGGHFIIECWDTKDYEDHINSCNESGKNPIRQLRKIMKDKMALEADIKDA